MKLIFPLILFGALLGTMMTRGLADTSAHIKEFASILNEPNNYLQAKELSANLTKLHPSDFPKALAQFPFNSECNREWILDQLICRWMEVDPQGAVAAVVQSRTMEDKDFAALVITDIYGDWAKKDPQAALAHAQQTLAGDERTIALAAVTAQMARSDPAQAYALARNIDWPNLTKYNATIFAEWADHNLPQATQVLLQFPDGLMDVYSSYAAANKGIVSRLFEKDPRSAVEWIAQLPPGNINRNAIEQLGDQWGRIDPQAAIKWSNSLPPEGDQAYFEIHTAWAEADPLGLLNYTAALPLNSSQDALYFWGVGQWAYEDAEAAGRWIAAQPPSHWRTYSYARMLDSWSDYDVEAAVAYLPQIPEGPDRDAAIKSVSDHLAMSDHARAYKLALAIHDPKALQDECVSLFKDWLKVDFTQASIVVRQSALPDDVKKELLKGGH